MKKVLIGLIFPAWLAAFIAIGILFGPIGVVFYAILTAYLLRGSGGVHF
jgi:hypothetical protein